MPCETPNPDVQSPLVLEDGTAGQVKTLTDQLQTLTASLDATDLAGLTNLHTMLESLSRLVEGSPNQTGPDAVGGQVRESIGLVERIILHEAQDAESALQQVTAAIAGMKRLTTPGGAFDGPQPQPSVAAESVVPAATGAGGQAGGVEHILGAQAALSDADLPLIHEFINEATEHLEAAEAALLRLEEDATDPESLNAVFRSFHTIKGVAGFLNLTHIGALAHAAENVLDRARQGALHFDGALSDLILHSVDAMRKLIERLRAAAAGSGGIPQAFDGLPQLLTQLRAAAEGRTAAPSAAPAPVSAPVASASASVAGGDPPQTAKAAEAHGVQSSGDATVKVSMERLDALINTVGELVIAQAMVHEDLAAQAHQDRRASRNLTHLGKISRELQDLSMAMRMVPVQGVFQKMSRLVRDLARKAGKEIDLVLVGGETELDRNVVEAISDPLVHMVRNSADHGIEAPEDRIKAGKPRAGTITLKASHQAGHVVIDISDDGRGLNKARILKKAQEARIVKPGQELDDQAIFQLIFHAGLSTAEKVTDVSGRGVGMDVVKRNVESLRGRIDITSKEGNGSTFSIRLPLTLAVIDGLAVKVGRQRYIIPMTSIERSIQPQANQISSIPGRGDICQVRDRLLPVLRLHQVFGVPAAQDNPATGLLVIVGDGANRCCLLVDELLGQQQVVIKSLGAGFGRLRGVAGAAILGDGNVSLILDVPGLIGLAADVKQPSQPLGLTKEPLAA